MVQQRKKKQGAKRILRNAKKVHEKMRGGAVNSFGTKNRRRTLRKGRAHKKRDALTPQDCIKKADQQQIKDVLITHHFSDFAFAPCLVKAIATVGYGEPTPIQDRAIPKVLEGRDVIGIAQTGTGKTAAFLLPLMQQCIMQKKKRVLVVVPTRELALQITQMYEDFAQNCNLSYALIVGGANTHAQEKALARDPRCIIGTPGRLHDLIEQKILSLESVTSVVIDEVDRMLDMGFLREIKYLLNHVRSERQMLLFSATLRKEMRQIARNFLKNPVTVAITPRLSSLNVKQDVVYIHNDDDKIEILHDILIRPEVRRAIVFVKTKFAVQLLGAELAERGFAVGMMQGDLSHGARKRILAQFKDGATDVLVATDLVARGIDVPDVTHVINYDVPDNYDDYVHRIGRTGRSAKTGQAVTFWEKE